MLTPLREANDEINGDELSVAAAWGYAPDQFVNGSRFTPFTPD
ncbi:MAG TPA: hypothetical protein VEY09_00115 [Pyrinomonadaceae bacterium]|nr:hypothetical protein [Pyrinomonadaceae bacterium]